MPRQVGQAHVDELVGGQERWQVLARMSRSDARVAQHAQAHRPEEVGDQVRDHRLGVDDGDVDVAERRADAVRTDEVDLDLGAGGAEVAQHRHRQLHGEARRHLHPQRALRRRAFVADVIERVFEPIEGLDDGRQQVLARLREHERVRPAFEQLHADQGLERDDVARQCALRDQQRIGGDREAAVLGDALERAQRVQRQPAAAYGGFVHRSASILTRPVPQRNDRRWCTAVVICMTFFDSIMPFIGFAAGSGCESLRPWIPSRKLASGKDWHRRSRTVQPDGRAIIDGQRRAALDGRSFDALSPIDGRKLGPVARCGAADVDAAVAAARRAFNQGSWRHLEPQQRKAALLRLAALMRDDLDNLALLETLDVGKPIRDSLSSDIPSAANCIAYYGEFADKLYDEVAPTGPNDLALVRREPLGVVAAIVPWNYPLIIAAWKVGPALVSGNSVVLKPAEQSPYTALRLGELALEAGIPPGVLNVVPGFGEEAGQALALHPDVDMVSFTGSTEVGKLMLRYAGESNLKRVALELGGKSPQVVLRDADLAAAASDIAWGIFYNQGETCNAGSRLICDAGIKAELLAEIKRVTATIRLGHPLDRCDRAWARSSTRGTCGACSATSTAGSRPARNSRWAATRRARTAAAITSRRPYSTRCARRWPSRARRSSGRCCP